MDNSAKIERVLRGFVSAGLIDNDTEKVLSYIHDDVVGIGMGDQGFVSSKDEIRRIIDTTPHKSSGSSYELDFQNILIKVLGNSASACARVVLTKTKGTVIEHSGILQSLHLVCENGRWLICAMHASPLEVSVESIDAYPLHFADKTLAHLRSKMQNDAFELMNASFSGGVLGAYISGEAFELYFANDSFLTMTGYERDEFERKFRHDLTRIIHPDDVPIMRRAHVKAFEHNADYEVSFRIVHKDGRPLWIIVRNRFTTDNYGAAVILGVFTDVTEIIRLQQKLKEQTEELTAQAEELTAQKTLLEEQSRALAISENRFRIALETTSNIIFDYDVISGNIMYSSTPKKAFDFVGNIADARDKLIIGGTIVDEYLKDFNDAFAFIKQGRPQAECIVKVRLATGKEIWNKISLSGVMDSHGSIVRAIGVLEDITKQKEAELELTQKSQRDPLTQLYNKITVAELITVRLAEPQSICSGVFMMLDIDYFKEINDTYGHPFGDKVLIAAANVLNDHFRANDIIGRLGGDEFCVFFTGMQTNRRIAQVICRAVNDIFTPPDGNPALSCSIGIATCSGATKSFDQIYHEADQALYNAKKSGRNGYAFFN